MIDIIDNNPGIKCRVKVPPETLALYDYWKTKESDDRVIELEGEGLTTSDAQGVADAEFLTKWRAKQ